MATPFDTFKSKLGVGQSKLKGVGYDYTPTIMQQGQTSDQIGQSVLDKLTQRKDAGQNIYTQNKQEGTSRLASDLVNKSAGLKFDEFGKPELKLGDFGNMFQSRIKGVSERGDLATQAAESRQAYQNAITQQNLGQYQFTGSFSVDASAAIPGASSDNIGARAASMAMQASTNNTPYVWGGNSLSTGVDCSGLVQQIYRQLGVNVPRTTYEQAKNGRQVSVNEVRPGDLVFYRNDLGHVGIYIGNGKIVHAANSKLGTITSNLNNSNGRPTLILRPY
jgi:cell wall-associated NlpC family hydrolase